MKDVARTLQNQAVSAVKANTFDDNIDLLEEMEYETSESGPALRLLSLAVVAYAWCSKLFYRLLRG